MIIKAEWDERCEDGREISTKIDVEFNVFDKESKARVERVVTACASLMDRMGFTKDEIDKAMKNVAWAKTSEGSRRNI
jgi:predicted Ser/Thr protein kinase